MRLENWGIVLGNLLDAYQAPELQTYKMMGNVYGHSYFEDGIIVTTSAIMKIENGVVHTRTGSKYELGEINEDYLELYPNAKALLLDSDDIDEDYLKELMSY